MVARILKSIVFCVGLSFSSAVALSTNALQAFAITDPFDTSIPLDKPMKIAVTMDDLPNHGTLAKGFTRIELAKKILSVFHEDKFQIPEVYGFTNGFQLEAYPADVEVLKAWMRGGYPLGNHTYSHMNLHHSTAEAFTADIAKGDKLLAALTRGTPFYDKRMYFRYPYLNEGDTAEKRDAVLAYLAKEKYKIAYTTIDYYDWSFNEAFSRCVAQGKSETINELKKSVLESARRQLRLAQYDAKKVYGHDIPHILLLHIGAFDSVMLEEVLEAYKKDGAEFIKLDDAMSFNLPDSNTSGLVASLAASLYDASSNLFFENGSSFLEQMAKMIDLKLLSDDPKFPMTWADKFCVN